MQLVVAVAAFCILFRRMMEQVGFPPREHWLKYAAWLVLYIVILYGTGWFFTQIAGNLVLLRLPILSYSIFACFWVRDCMQSISGDMETTHG